VDLPFGARPESVDPGTQIAAAERRKARVPYGTLTRFAMARRSYSAPKRRSAPSLPKGGKERGK